jgi:hypothetical protein
LFANATAAMFLLRRGNKRLSRLSGGLVIRWTARSPRAPVPDQARLEVGEALS